MMVLATNLFPKRRSLPLELVEPCVSPALSPITGESVQTHLELRNVGAKPITVLRARSSCGCTQVFPTNTPKQVEDVVVPPHGKIKWTVVVDTSSRSGGHQFFVWFDYLDSGTQHTIRGAVRLSIRPCFWANPPVVSVNCARVEGPETAVARFAICDDGREDDLSISKTTVSDPRAIKWSIEEVRVDGAHRHVHSPRIRYRVTLTITPERTKSGSEAHSRVIEIRIMRPWKDNYNVRFEDDDKTLLTVPIHIMRPLDSNRVR